MSVLTIGSCADALAENIAEDILFDLQAYLTTVPSLGLFGSDFFLLYLAFPPEVRILQDCRGALKVKCSLVIGIKILHYTSLILVFD